MVLTGLPPLCELWLGRSIIMPVSFIAVPGATRYLQPVFVALSSILNGIRKVQPFMRRKSWRTADVAGDCVTGNRNVLDE